MKAFASLYRDLDQTTSTNEKVHAMSKFFKSHDPETCAWTLYFLSGRRPKRSVGSGQLRAWIQEQVGYSDWLMDECYAAVGDTAEMVALIAGANRQPTTEPREQNESQDLSLAEWMIERILPLKAMDAAAQKERVKSWWREFDTSEIFVLNKLITGGLRVGVSETLVLRALEEVTSLPRSVIAARIFGEWAPTAEFFESLFKPPEENDARTPEALPVPFCLAAPLSGEPGELGDIKNWLIEWKWDGIRCQIVKSRNAIEIWSRGEERVTDSFPDLARDALAMPGEWTLDGELVAGVEALPLPFQELQKRLNRKKPSVDFQKLNPVSFFAYDLLRLNHDSLIELPLKLRRTWLAAFMSSLPSEQKARFRLSEGLKLQTWEMAGKLRLISRQYGAEGLMLKNLSSPYEYGRKRGIWFKWKIDPLTIDVVLTSAQPGTGRRASLYTDYTFSIWHAGKLVPIAKAYSGLSDEEIRSLDNWIRRNTVERYGPVRAVAPVRVFELGFEGIAQSKRHKSGYAVRFPRILRERTDKKPEDADTTDSLQALYASIRDRQDADGPASSRQTDKSPAAKDQYDLFSQRGPE